MDILKRSNGEVLYSSSLTTLKEVVVEAVKNGADLHGADLSGANLDSADLSGANLDSADLHGANLYGADLSGANLHGANLHGANLYGAGLYGAKLHGANLHGANLDGANLYGIFLSVATILPEGTLIGWKKLRHGVIAKLEIPEDALRVNAIGSRKCRASKAIVLGLYNSRSWSVGLSSGDAISQYDRYFHYEVGKTVIPDSFDDDVRVECSHGIHFFITRQEAEDY